MSPNGGDDIHGSFDVLSSSQHLNGHWETLELYLVRTFILFHARCFKIFSNTSVIWFLYKNIIGLSDNICPVYIEILEGPWCMTSIATSNYETGKWHLDSKLRGNLLPASYLNLIDSTWTSIWEFGGFQILNSIFQERFKLRLIAIKKKKQGRD